MTCSHAFRDFDVGVRGCARCGKLIFRTPEHEIKTTHGLRPLGKQVLLKQLDEERKTPGGLHIPDHVAERPPEGKVIACGPEVTKLRVGEVVVFRKWSTKNIIDKETGLIVMDEDEALAVRE